MTRYKHFILLILMFALFAVVSPVITFYVQGYRFDFKEMSFFRTGGMYLQTTPKKARIFLNDKALKNGTPLLINGLLPKNFHVKITKENFYPWEKYIKIESGLVNEAKNIILVPDKISENLLFSPAIKLYSSPSGNYGLTIAENDNDIVMINKEKRRSINLQNAYQKEQIAYALKNNQTVWADNETKIIAYYKHDNYILDFSEQTITHFFIKKSELKKSDADGFIQPLQMQWHPTIDNSVLFIYDGRLYAYDLRDKKSSILTDNAIYYKTVSLTLNSYVYYMGNLGLIRKYNFITQNNEKLSEVPLNYNNGDELLIAPDQKKIAFFDKKNRKLFLMSNGDIKIINDADFAQFASDSKKILYGNKNKVWVFFMEDDNEYPEKRRGTTEELASSDNGDINNAFWRAPDNRHLWIAANDLYFTELDNRPPRNTYTILNNISSDIFINENEIYYLRGNDLYYSDVFPQ